MHTRPQPCRPSPLRRRPQVDRMTQRLSGVAAAQRPRVTGPEVRSEMPKTILVVDDKESVRTLVRDYLRAEGFRVVTAENGRVALTVARHEKPDLILLDIMMPEMDGYEFVRAYRKERETPIILLTARLEETDKVLGLELGADDYVTKPFGMKELVARIRAVLRRAQQPAAEGEVLSRGRRHPGQGRPHRGGGPAQRPPDAFGVRPAGGADVGARPGLYPRQRCWSSSRASRSRAWSAPSTCTSATCGPNWSRTPATPATSRRSLASAIASAPTGTGSPCARSSSSSPWPFSSSA